MNLWIVGAALSILVGSNHGAAQAQEAAPGTRQTLYPFVRDGLWGFIDATGAWVIEPRFDGAMFIFEKVHVQVEQRGRWGYIDRKGDWLVPPQFTSSSVAPIGSPVELIVKGNKEGLLSPAAEILLPPQYDEIELWGDRAFVRRGNKLGLFAVDGHWILKPSLDWPRGREMPMTTPAGVAWFKRGAKWGLLSHDGKILFGPQFSEHVLGRRESEWNHPEGLDFKNGRAWVTVGHKYWLINTAGRVLARHAFLRVDPWTDDIYLFEGAEGKKGLVSKDGKVVLAARFDEIEPPAEGMAGVVERKTTKRADGEIENLWTYGYLDEQGTIVVEPGIYQGPGGPNRGQTELAPFSDGLAPVWNHGPVGPNGAAPERYAGYIDRSGALAIAEQFSRTHSFSEGLGSVGQLIQGRPAALREEYEWGYVDKVGSLVIRPQFGDTTPFYRDRAWVLQAGADPQQDSWAMIDRHGKVLTDFTYRPPESQRWSAYDDKDLLKNRWHDDLAVLARGNIDFVMGLATPDGQVLIEPKFFFIGEFHGGLAVAWERGGHAPGDAPKKSFITKHGVVLADGLYTQIRDFDQGIAWVARRSPDHADIFLPDGWGLIDTAARERCELKYARVDWVQGMNPHFDPYRCPQFVGELAPVMLMAGYRREGKTDGQLNSWGYVNRAGKIVAWHEAPPADPSKHGTDASRHPSPVKNSPPLAAPSVAPRSASRR